MRMGQVAAESSLPLPQFSHPVPTGKSASRATLAPAPHRHHTAPHRTALVFHFHLAGAMPRGASAPPLLLTFALFFLFFVRCYLPAPHHTALSSLSTPAPHRTLICTSAALHSYLTTITNICTSPHLRFFLSLLQVNVDWGA